MTTHVGLTRVERIEKIVDNITGAMMEGEVHFEYELKPDEIDEVKKRVEEEVSWHKLNYIMTPGRLPSENGNLWLQFMMPIYNKDGTLWIPTEHQAIEI